MSLTITEYRCKLINKILFANSQEEVCRYIEAAMRGLRENRVNGHLVSRFVEKAAQDLQGFNSLNHDDQQWVNIKMARTQFDELKRAIKNSETGR